MTRVPFYNYWFLTSCYRYLHWRLFWKSHKWPDYLLTHHDGIFESLFPWSFRLFSHCDQIKSDFWTIRDTREHLLSTAVHSRLNKQYTSWTEEKKKKRGSSLNIIPWVVAFAAPNETLWKTAVTYYSNTCRPTTTSIFLLPENNVGRGEPRDICAPVYPRVRSGRFVTSSSKLSVESALFFIDDLSWVYIYLCTWFFCSNLHLFPS